MEIQPAARWPRVYCVTTPEIASKSRARGPVELRPARGNCRDEGVGHRHILPPLKSVDEFTGQHFDYVLTVCDNAKESCPIFPGQTPAIHRNFDEPAAVQSSEEERLAAFRCVRDELREYLKTFRPQA